MGKVEAMEVQVNDGGMPTPRDVILSALGQADDFSEIVIMGKRKDDEKVLIGYSEMLPVNICGWLFVAAQSISEGMGQNNDTKRKENG
jgi:hypothetical protein